MFVVYCLSSVLARRKSSAEAQRLARASLWVSIGGIVVGIATILFLFLPTLSSNGFCGTVWEYDWNRTDVYWRELTTQPPEVTSSGWCHVVGNDTTCFRFASSFTAELCATVDGVTVNISTLRSSTLPPALTATLASVICYHNVCADSYIVDSSCFQYRLAFYTVTPPPPQPLCTCPTVGCIKPSARTCETK